MKKTKHADKRFQQRGFSGFTLDLILKYGKCIQAPGGAIKIFFGNREYQSAVGEFKRAIQLLDKAKGGNIIIEGNSIITGYRNYS